MQGGFIGPDVLSLKTRELGCGAGDWEADWAEYSSTHHPRLDTGLSQASATESRYECYWRMYAGRAAVPAVSVHQAGED